ncbi:hypothetical protein V2J56_09285 [Georgenia sp. MJ206]|uniref:hypothetical protein n=1 Tax=Georgenia wangjunii TaxID=3117730 RepID=UPI002F2694AE
MAFHTFGPLLIVDARSLEPVAGAAVTVVDADTGEAVTPYAMGADPAVVQLVTNTRGYVGQFQTDDAHTHVRATVAAAGVDPVHLTAKEAGSAVAEAASEVRATRAMMLTGGVVQGGTLVLTRYGGGIINAGYVKGPQGDPGAPGEPGAPGPPGPPGAGVDGGLVPVPGRPGAYTISAGGTP